MIYIEDVIAGIVEKEFEGVKTRTAQFLSTNASGALTILNVKILKNYNIKDKVKIQVSVSCFENKIYFKEVE